MLGNIKAAIKLFILVTWIALCFALLAVAYKFGKLNLRDRIMRISTAGVLKIIGVRVTMTGTPSAIRPLMMVSNHISYLDILVMNSRSIMHFTPKQEIAGWPVLGTIARMSGGIFVDRRPEKLGEGKDRILSALAKGDAVCLFPEATTGNGLNMVPFKSGFFSLAGEEIEGKELTVQPVAVTYTTICRLPIDTTQWHLIAWYGDMEVVPHLWDLLKLGPIGAELVFLEPVTLKEFGNRKKLAAHCQKMIQQAIEGIRARHRHTAYAKTVKFSPRLMRIKN